jgi:hypothetical protein
VEGHSHHSHPQSGWDSELHAACSRALTHLCMPVAAAAICMLTCLACSKSKKALPDAAKEPAFLCLKVSAGPGVGRRCAGPGFAPSGAADADLFESSDAWCITVRVSWANAKSRMACVPTNAECSRDLLVTPAGKHNLFARTPCVRVLPKEWSATEQSYSKEDAFLCASERAFLALDDSYVVACRPTPAELLTEGETARQAWCFEGPNPGEMFNLHCYREQGDCEREKKNHSTAKTACAMLEIGAAIRAEFGGLDKP